MVERTIAWLTRGNRRLRYRGVAKNDAWLHLRVAAINLRRLLNLGLTGTDGQWAFTQDSSRTHRPDHRLWTSRANRTTVKHGQGDLFLRTPGC
jgi:Transposase DDE domain